MGKINSNTKSILPPEKKYRLLAENSTDVIGLFDKNFKLLYISPSSSELSGYSLEDLRGKNVFDMIHPEDREWLLKKTKQNVQEKAFRRTTTFRIFTKSGRLKWVESITKYLYGGYNLPIGHCERSLHIREFISGKKFGI